MKYTLDDIRKLRKKYNLTQKELSNLSGVSQSLIAKVEAGQVEPTYSKTMQIFEILEMQREKDETKAKEVMTKKLITVNKTETVDKVIELMKNKGVSQFPVLDKNQICGLITESIILESTIKHSGRITHLKAGDIMEEAPPTVPLTTGLRTILELLRNSSVVLVMEKGELKGIISKSDVLGKE